MAFTNETDIPLALAVWLVNDDYDHNGMENYVSVTGLMKPLRHIILPRRIKGHVDQDLEDLIPSSLGNAIHDSIEKAWVKNHTKNLKKLGYPEDVIARILVNATPEEIAAVNDPVLVFIEQRAIKSFKGWHIGGKFDMVADGIVMDNKSTTAYTWVHGGRDEDYKLQGSIYKWLNPDKIFHDFIRINFIFTDWQRAQARQNPNYPQSRLRYKDIPLMTHEETEMWIGRKIQLVEKFMDAPETEIPECTEEELWMSDPQFKFYLKEETFKTGGKSTKNCDSMSEALEYQASKGGRGLIVTVPGEPKRCGYCNAFDACTQKDKYFP